MTSVAEIVIGRLRLRRAELEEAIFIRVHDLVPGQADELDAEYVTGVRAAVSAAIEFGLTGIERNERLPTAIPDATAAQARRAASSGVSLEAVLRRYVAGYALLWEYVMEEAALIHLDETGDALRVVLRTQAALLDRLVSGVTREHVAERQRSARSHEQRLLDHVQMLLAGESADGKSLGGYRLDGEHIGLIARGRGAREVLRETAGCLDRELLCATRANDTVWAWLGARREFGAQELVEAISAQLRTVEHAGISVVVGEPGPGLEGWRRTHRQAQAALLVALRRPQPVTRYADVALLAAALSDSTLARSLLDIYLCPLEQSRDGGAVLRETLRAYFAAERNASAAAAALGVARNTVENRLRTVERLLGHSLQPFPAELEVAVALADIDGVAVSPQGV